MEFALSNGAELKTWVIAVAGNIFLIVLAVRAIGHYAKREWGELLAHFIAGVVVAGFVYSPDSAKNMLTAIWAKVAGA
ncbi:TcpD family membrane protein [Streptomyces sp. NPDC046215]